MNFYSRFTPLFGSMARMMKKPDKKTVSGSIAFIISDLLIFSLLSFLFAGSTSTIYIIVMSTAIVVLVYALLRSLRKKEGGKDYKTIAILVIIIIGVVVSIIMLLRDI